MRASLLADWGLEQAQGEQGTSSRFLLEERRVLRLITEGAKLKEVLDALTAGIERMLPGCYCSILLLDAGGRLREGSDGGLPEEFIKKMYGLAVGPDSCSCGSAAYLNETVIVTNIATDRRWAGAKELPLSFGLRACWSVPIRGANNKVLGTFAMYHPQVAGPRPEQVSVVEACGAHLAGNAIERLTAEQKLLENAERMKLAEEAASFGVWEMDLDTGIADRIGGLGRTGGLPGRHHRPAFRPGPSGGSSRRSPPAAGRYRSSLGRRIGRPRLPHGAPTRRHSLAPHRGGRALCRWQTQALDRSHHRHHRTKGDADIAGAGPREGRSGRAGQERFSGEHEP